MRLAHSNRLPVGDQPTIMGARRGAVLFAALCCANGSVAAQEQAAPTRDDLDVTMQIIVDPDAKLPDDVVRKIPLPVRSSARSAAQGTAKSGDTAGKDQTRTEAARDLERGVSERAKERAQDAAQQREQAGRTIAEEHRQNPPRADPPSRPDTPGPADSPGRPETPPGRP